MIHVSTKRARRALARVLATAFAAVALGACDPAGPEHPPGPISVETYTAVMSALVHLDRFPPPGRDLAARTERADSIRHAILERYRVSVDELLEFAESAGEQPALMLEIADRIVEMTDSLARERREADAAGRDSAEALDEETSGDTDVTSGDRSPTPEAERPALSPRPRERMRAPGRLFQRPGERRDSAVVPTGDTTP